MQPYCDYCQTNWATHELDTQFAGTHRSCHQCLVTLPDKQHYTPLPTAPDPQPPSEQYLLDKLQEEAAEVIQAVSKMRRFGPHNHHPDRTTTNLEELVGELEDFQAIVLALFEINSLDPKPSLTQTIKKYNALMGS